MTLQLIQKDLLESELLKNTFGSELNKYVVSVLNEIKKTVGDEKKDLSNCKPDSIISAIKHAHDLQLEIDSRAHCHLVKYGNVANLQVGYKGFIYAIKRSYPDANIDCRLVYAGDTFVLKSDGDSTSYEYEAKDHFSVKKPENVVGGYCHISYTLGTRLVSFCETMTLDEIKKIRGVAKQDFIWQKWFEEKAKVAIIRRAAKVHFSGIQQIERLIEFDNQDFDLKKESVVEPILDPIDSAQKTEIEQLAKKKGVKISKICNAYTINSIIDLPLSKFEAVKKTLSGKPDIAEAKNENS